MNVGLKMRIQKIIALVLMMAMVFGLFQADGMVTYAYNAQAGMIGGINDIWSGVNNYEHAGVRPAMWIDLNALQMQLESDELSKKISSLGEDKCCKNHASAKKVFSC